MVSVFRSSLINKVENPTILKRETEREILIELAIIDTCSKYLKGDISREFLSWANFEQLKSEMERIEQRQRELDAQKGARPKERVVTSSRPESRMEVDEAPRSRGRFNLDREAREHMSEGLEVWIPNEATSPCVAWKRNIYAR